MKKFFTLVLFVLSSVFIYGKEWTFELSPNQIRMCSSNKLQRPSYFIDSCKTKNMVNLSFFTSKTYIGPYKDRRVSSYDSPKNWPFFVIERGEAYIYDGISWGQTFNLKMIGLTTDYMVSGYPVLLQDGKKKKVRKSFFSRRKCPRTAIGIHPNGSVFLYVTTRATIRDLQEYFTSIGCTDAINFDGGSSTFLYLEGKKVYSSNEGRSYPNVLYWD
jgi:exopolysaccharide biosynthesis protein